MICSTFHHYKFHEINLFEYVSPQRLKGTANSTELLLSQICVVVPCLGKERLNLQDIFSSVDNQKIPEIIAQFRNQ